MSAQPHLLVRPDDEHCVRLTVSLASGGSFVEGCDGAVFVADERKVQCMTLGVAMFARRGSMAIHRVDTHPDQFGVATVELVRRRRANAPSSVVQPA